MAFNIENVSGVVLSIDDLGITLSIGEEIDLNLVEDGLIVATSANGGDLESLVTVGNLIVKDPWDGVTPLSLADALEALRAKNEPNWRVGLGARIGDISDVDLVTVPPADNDFLSYDNATGNWVPQAGGGGSTQNLWETVNADSGSTTANTPTDTLTITGGTGISTAIVGDTLTISASGGGPGADELVKVTANDTTSGYLFDKLTPTVNQIDLVEVNDGSNETLNISISNNAQFPGNEGVTVPSGTEGERPVSPNVGEVRLNTSNGFLEYWNGTQWITLVGNSTGPGTTQGTNVGFHYVMNSKAQNTWVGTLDTQLPSSVTQYIMPYDAIITGITYGNDSPLSDTDVYLEFASELAGSSNTTIYRWEIRNTRIARNTFIGELFEIDFTGITGLSLPNGGQPAAYFNVPISTSAYIFPGKVIRFWFSDGSTTPPTTPPGGSLVAIPFVGTETDQQISDLVVTAMTVTSAEEDLSNADNLGGTTPIISCKLVYGGNVDNPTDGTIPTNAVFTQIQQGGPYGVPMSRGGKLGVYLKDPGSGSGPKAPANVIFSVFVQWAEDPHEQEYETYTGSWNTP